MVLQPPARAPSQTRVSTVLHPPPSTSRGSQGTNSTSLQSPPLSGPPGAPLPPHLLPQRPDSLLDVSELPQSPGVTGA